MEGTGKLELTGSLGDVMQESAKAAVTCIRSHASALGIDSDFTRIRIFTFMLPRVPFPRTDRLPASQWLLRYTRL